MPEPFLIALINLAVVGCLSTAGWLYSLHRKNVTIADSLWGLGFVLVALVNAWMGSGVTGRSMLVLVLTTVWGLRLSVYLTCRNHGKPEDHRYGQWREKSGAAFWWVSLLKVFWLQALFIWAISLVLHQAQLAGRPAHFTLLDALGTLLWSTGFFFEAVGDWQLARFKADPVNAGQVMDRGLWAWSRHPNYFGECLIWWGFFLVALATHGSLWTIISPAMVTWVLLKITGIPLTEAALNNRRPDYRDYVKRTSRFFPRPPA